MSFFGGLGDLVSKGLGWATGVATGNPWLGSAISGGLNFLGGEMTNASNRSIAADNRAFQADMANTAHQREVADLEKAGLNPVLSASGGSGAMTPTPPTPVMQNPMGTVPGGISSGIQMAQLDANLKNISADSAAKLASAAASLAGARSKGMGELEGDVAQGVESLAKDAWSNTLTNLGDIKDAVGRLGVSTGKGVSELYNNLFGQ